MRHSGHKRMEWASQVPMSWLFPTECRDATTSVAESHSARLLDTRSLLAPLAIAAFAEDGLHISGAAYRLLLPALAQCGLPG